MRKLLLLGLLLAWSTGSAIAAPLQIDISLLGASPVGTYNDGTTASDYFNAGGGVLGDVMFGLNENLFIGGQIGVYENSGSTFDTDYSLTTVPLHALLQYRTSGDAQFGFFGQAGIGVSSLKVDVSSLDGDQNTTQSGLSFLVGAGVSYALSDTWHLTSSLNYHQTQTPGDCNTNFYCDGDNPKSILFTFGARYSKQ